MLETSVINNRPIDRMRFTFPGLCVHTPSNMMSGTKKMFRPDS